jgi:ribonuclease HI
MIEAISWVQNHNTNNINLKYAIYTDSLSLIQAIKSNSWKDEHEWMRRIKKLLDDNIADLTLCWIPSHVDTYGNDKADKLADLGTEEAQADAPVTFNIVKAKVKNKKWKITHPRAKDTFVGMWKPKERENSWPPKVKRLFARLRSGHAKELRSYQHRVGMDSQPICTYCTADAPETIEHVLCHCETLDATRVALWPEDFTISMLGSHPEICRKVLEKRFIGLRCEIKMEEDQGGGDPVGREGPQLE